MGDSNNPEESASDQPSPFNRAVHQAVESVKPRYSGDSKKMPYVKWVEDKLAPYQTEQGYLYVDNELSTLVASMVASNKAPKHLRDALKQVLKGSHQKIIVSGDFFRKLLHEVHTLRTQNHALMHRTLRNEKYIKQLESKISDLRDENRSKDEQLQALAQEKGPIAVAYIDTCRELEEERRLRYETLKVAGNMDIDYQQAARKKVMEETAKIKQQAEAEKQQAYLEGYQKGVQEVKQQLHAGELNSQMATPGGSQRDFPLDPHLTSPDASPPGSPQKVTPPMTPPQVSPEAQRKNSTARRTLFGSEAVANQPHRKFSPNAKSGTKKPRQYKPEDWQSFHDRRAMVGDTGELRPMQQSLFALDLTTMPRKKGELGRIKRSMAKKGLTVHDNSSSSVADKGEPRRHSL